MNHMSPAQSLRDKINGLVLQARALPDPLAAARLLRLRAKRMEETPLSRWPKGVTAPDFIQAVDTLRLEAQRLTHS